MSSTAYATEEILFVVAAGTRRAWSAGPGCPPGGNADPGARSRKHGYGARVFTSLKRLLVGRPIATSEQEHQRLRKLVALPTFSSDALSSTAYATEEILFVVAAGGSSLALGLSRLVPLSIVVAALLTIVVLSYRQTIYAYPHGGSSYVVSRENLGAKASLVAGASILVDYVLTVAVSISAGVAAIVSLPAFRSWTHQRVTIGLALILIITLANLRGMKESGTLFAFPTYLYVATVATMVVYGLYKVYFGDIGHIEFDPAKAEIQREAGGQLGLFLLLKGFSSGAVALTGIEAIADGVPAFRKPQTRNAATTMMIMASILGTLFFGVSVLAHHLRPFPSHDETVISQIGRTVFGEGPIYVVLQLATVAILTLAANTAYADFPRLSSIIARDGYLPRYLGNRGDRLVFSNGIIILAVAASLLIIAFGGITNALIPLYAVGVFTSFTLSQTGMVIHHRRTRDPGWKTGMVISGLGATATFIVLLIVAITKFTSGAWVPIMVVPAIIALFSGIKRHYTRVAESLEISPAEVRPQPFNHTVVVLVGRVHRGVIQALGYARSLRPQHLIALYISHEDDDREEIERQWREFGINVDLEIKHSKYRELVRPVMEYLDELDERWNNDTITVVVPEFVVGKWYEHLLHNQSALLLKGRLLFREGTVVTSVPYHVDRYGITPPGHPGAVTGAGTEDENGNKDGSDGRPAPAAVAAPTEGDAREGEGAPSGA
ncbi:MAG: APC family permease [Actinomycetota bacterium]|nr:APC family permease [Actinomycetota bacterium]